MTLTLSSEIEKALTAAAVKVGRSPEELAEESLREKYAPAAESSGQPRQTLAEALAGRIGTQSSGRGDLSQNTGKAFTRLMVEKHKAGRL